MDERVGRTIGAFQRNNIEAIFVKDREEALREALARIPSGSKVGLGGSTTVVEIGLLKALRGGPYFLSDQYREGISWEESYRIRKEGLRADVFVTSSNAITLKGQLVNIDGIGNRLAGLAYGPEKVIVIAGVNKLCSTLEEAIDRVKNVAAPKNAQRFGLSLPCIEAKKCVDCQSPDRICNVTMIIERQWLKDRMTVILVGETLGF